MKELGIAEPESNLYHLYAKRSSILEKFADKKLRKVRSVGSGQKSLLPKTEAAVKRMIEEKRRLSLRVSKRAAKKWLRETAHQLEPNQASKLKFSTKYFANAFRRMGVVARRISSCKSVDNETAALYGRFYCHQLMQLKENGWSTIFNDKTWCTDQMKDPVHGFFPPDAIFAADEVPFNFAAERMTVTEKGKDAAVRSLRGTGKRFGTCVILCSADGELLKFVLILKAGKKGLPPDEVERFKQYSNVIVTYSESSYITEEIWRKVVITQVLFRHIQKKGGQDFWKDVTSFSLTIIHLIRQKVF